MLSNTTFHQFVLWCFRSHPLFPNSCSGLFLHAPIRPQHNHPPHRQSTSTSVLLQLRHIHSLRERSTVWLYHDPWLCGVHVFRLMRDTLIRVSLLSHAKVRLCSVKSSTNQVYCAPKTWFHASASKNISVLLTWEPSTRMYFLNSMLWEVFNL